MHVRLHAESMAPDAICGRSDPNSSPKLRSKRGKENFISCAKVHNVPTSSQSYSTPHAHVTFPSSSILHVIRMKPAVAYAHHLGLVKTRPTQFIIEIFEPLRILGSIPWVATT